MRPLRTRRNKSMTQQGLGPGQGPRTPLGGMSSASILILSDDPMSGRLLNQILTKVGYQVAQVGSARALHAHITQHVPQLILLDVVMPDADTYELCIELKKNKATAPIPVMFLSAIQQAIDKVKAFEVGGADYLMKPFQPAEVLARIEHQLKLARLQRELEQEKAALQKSYELLRGAHQRISLMSGVLSEQLAGTTLDGKYLLNVKLGSGGFGIVYKGLQLSLQRPVAVKVLRLLNLDDPEVQLERFRREGISTCRVRHKNAIEVIDTAVSAEGIPYMVMELLSGRSLQDELYAHQGSLSLGRCMDIIIPVCEVLAEAHGAGVVHRDIKPENIFLHQSPQGEVIKVLDFGIASLRDMDDAPMTRLTKPHFVLGTALYMAPERVKGTGDIDGRSDVYSVAVMLYIMLTGESPFAIECDDNLKLMLAHLNDPPIPLHQHLPSVPVAIELAVMAGMAKKPAQRPTAKEYLQGLREAFDSLGKSA